MKTRWKVLPLCEQWQMMHNLDFLQRTCPECGGPMHRVSFLGYRDSATGQIRAAIGWRCIRPHRLAMERLTGLDNLCTLDTHVGGVA